MEKLNFRSITKILPERQRNQLWLLSFARIMANGLDLVGLAGIALLATSFGSIASGTAGQTPLVLPLIGGVIITEVEAVIMALLITLTFFLKSLFSIWLNLRTALKVAEIEGDFAERLTRNFFDVEALDRGSLNEAVSKFQSSILVSTSAIAGFLNARISAVAEGSLLALLLVLFVLVSPVATLATVGYLGLVVVALNKIVNSRLRRISEQIIVGSEESLSVSRDLFGVRQEVRLAGTNSMWLGRISSAKRQSARGHGLHFTINSLPRYVIETSLILGIFLFLGGIVVFSDLNSQAVAVGVFLAGGLRLVASLLPLQSALNSMVATGATAQSAFETLLRIEDRVPSVQLQAPAELTLSPIFNLDFVDVEFYHYGADRPSLAGINFNIAEGSKAAIVGPSGSGKTTLVELATGFRLPNAGKISISGYSPRELLELAPGVIAIVPQRPHLITGTIAENVSLELGSSTDEAKAIECLNKAGLEHLVGNNFEGIGRKIFPDSDQLSGGEVQRLGIARALYRNPRILFLDEATSALDAETESKISNVLDVLRSEITVVLIAHRLSTVMNAEKIIYLDNGKIVAQGTFSELKKQVPGFARAVKLMDLSDHTG